MNDFIKWVMLCFAVLMVVVSLIGLTARLEKLEQAIPLPCRTMQSLLKSRPIPVIHSYSRPMRVCEDQP